MKFTDTHCHIHSKDYPLDPEDVIKDATKDGVTRLICVGQELDDSKIAIEFVSKHENTWASIGIHPHESKHFSKNQKALDEFASLVKKPKVVAIGECGLDYYYNH